tara:strand:- start:8419 stop:8988 length:570 start_codon:yes stop_codon:yes gene_type:complete
MKPDTPICYRSLYPAVTHDIWQRAQQIKLLICDVDGVFSDGRIYLGNDGEELKAFHTRDGFGIKALLSQNIEVAIITGRQSKIVAQRMQHLGIEYIYQGCENKIQPYQSLLQDLELKAHEIAYIGDDLVDLDVMRHCGLAVTVQDGHPLVQREAHWTTQARGGFGAVRELCDILLISKNKLTCAQGQSI